MPRSYPNSTSFFSGIFFRNQAQSLKNQGIEVSVLAYLNLSLKVRLKNRFFVNRIKHQNDKDIPVTYYYATALPFFPKINFIRRKKHSLKMIEEYIKTYGKPDIIHVHCAEAGEAAVIAKHKYGIPYVVTEHSSRLFRDDLKSWYLSLIERVYKHSSHNIAVSNKLSKSIYGKFAVNSSVIPNMVDTSFFNYSPEQKSDTDKTRFIQIGNLTSNKNHIEVVKAMALIKKQGINAELVIIGEGEKYSELVKEVEINNLSDSVKLVGNKTREEIKDYLQRSDYLILSSLKETFGVVLIEAMSCGLPVITTKNGGGQDIVKNGYNGAICEFDHVSLAKAMSEVRNVKWSRKKIAEYASENYSREKVSESLINVYEKVLKGDLDN